jgi:hypothetical protein
LASSARPKSRTGTKIAGSGALTEPRSTDAAQHAGIRHDTLATADPRWEACCARAETIGRLRAEAAFAEAGPAVRGADFE